MRRLLMIAAALFGAAAVMFATIRLLQPEPAVRRSDEIVPSLLLHCGVGTAAPVADTDSAHLGGGLVDLFMRRYGLRVDVNYDASQRLLDHLDATRRGDLLLPDDDYYIREARAAGLVREERRIARLSPLIVVAPGNPHGLRAVRDLADPQLRLAVADPRIDGVGRVTPEIFAKNDVDFESLSNVRLTARTALEALRAVAAGQADAAIVWCAMARQYAHAVDAIEIPPDDNLVSYLAVAVLNNAENPTAARQFADFIAGPAGRAHFARFHYDVAGVAD